MTAHKTGTREQWLKSRIELLKAEKELTRRGDELARQRQELPWVPINKVTASKPNRGAPRSPIFSVGAINSSSITSCLDLTTPRAVHRAPQLRTALTGSVCTSPITM